MSALCLHALDAPKADAPKQGEPTDAKARKTFNSAIEWLKNGDVGSALANFRKANKQDGGRCSECLRQAYSLAIAVSAFGDAESIAREWLPAAQTDLEKAAVHYRIGYAFQQRCIILKKDNCYSSGAVEFRDALELDPSLPAPHYALAMSLAQLHKDEAARAEFKAFLDLDKGQSVMDKRAERFIERIDLARATMAPPFAVVTLDGQHVSMDGLAGKVVLIDFWATWCASCVDALPHIRKIAHMFEGQPFAVLSISVDTDDAKWRSFVAKNGMTWLQYRDTGIDGLVSNQFGVNMIPATFTIDVDGVLEERHFGDAEIEYKLKKLIAQAVEAADRKSIVAAPAKDSAIAK